MGLRIDSPYHHCQGSWYRGNLHTHTTESDGDFSPCEVIQKYSDQGYNWLCLTDHDKITPPPSPLPNGILVFSGNEITNRGPHILHIGASELIEPKADRKLVLEDIHKKQGFCILNHPNWEKTFSHWPQDTIESLPKTFQGLEIFNGVVQRQEGNPQATDRWDMLLSKGYRVWGYANDDFHGIEDMTRGWNMVCAKDCTIDEIIGGLREGRFYCSTGVSLSTLEVNEHSVRIIATNGSLCVASGDWGIELGRFAGRAWELDIAELARDRRPGYIRFEILGDMGMKAWTQPLFLRWD